MCGTVHQQDHPPGRRTKHKTQNPNYISKQLKNRSIKTTATTTITTIPVDKEKEEDEEKEKRRRGEGSLER